MVVSLVDLMYPEGRLFVNTQNEINVYLRPNVTAPKKTIPKGELRCLILCNKVADEVMGHNVWIEVSAWGLQYFIINVQLSREFKLC